MSEPAFYQPMLSLDQLPDEVLMERFSRSLDERYLAPLLARYHRPALMVALRYTANPSDAEDLLQETCIRVVRRHASFCPDKSFAGWFYAILRNVSVDFLRAKKCRPATLPEPIDPESFPELVAPNDPVGRWDEFLRGLPPADREILVYRYRHGMTFPEIAGVTGEAEEAIRKRAQRALAKLRALFASREDALDRMFG